MKKFIALMVLITIATTVLAQDYLGLAESTLKKKTALQKGVDRKNKPYTYTMKEGTRTFTYFINRRTKRADGLEIKFRSASDREKYLKELVDGKNWQYTTEDKISIRGIPQKGIQADAYVQKNYPNSEAGAVVFSVKQEPVKQPKK